MARDRLAAMRAQREGTAAQPAAQSGNYEMAGLRQHDRIAPSGAAGGAGAADGGGFTSFQQEITNIQGLLRQFESNVASISDLHARSLSNMDPNSSQQISAQLDETVAETRALSNELKNRITALESKSAGGADARMQKNQSALVKKKFVEALQNYQKVEADYRTRYKQRVERQFKIVKPDATAAEVSAVVNDSQGGSQIFAQALSSSTRYSESRMAYREAQERHEDIRRIEQTMAELAELVNDMSMLIAKDDEAIDTIQTTALGVSTDMESGVKQTEKAVDSARRARKMRWICFWLTVILLAIVAIVVAVVVTQVIKK